MEPKTLTWALGLVIIACSLSVVSSDANRSSGNSSSTVSPSSSSSSGSSVSGHVVKSQQRNVTQVRTVIYRKTVRVPSSQQQSQWTSNGVWVNTSRTVHIKRYVGPVIINASSIYIFSSHLYVPIIEYKTIIPGHVFLSLQVAERFRNNVIYIIGYLLQSEKSLLTMQQYSSLTIIYNALQRKQVHMYRLLPALINLRGQTKTVQLHIIMRELSKYLPLYYTCSATFWAGQIHNNIFNLDAVLIHEQEKFDLFTGISAKEIEIVRKYGANDEKAAYDYNSGHTETLLGRVFVKIFQSINIHRLNLSQQLFALILMNLRNPDGDIVFEENIQYVAELAWRNEIPNWEQIGGNKPNFREPYTLIDMMTERINKNEKVSTNVRHAMLYIRTHLWEQQRYVMTAHETYLLTGKGGLDITYLLSLITVGEFNVQAVQMKNTLLEFTYTHTHVIEFILRGMNKYAYVSTQELLQVFLIRLRMRLPAEYEEIRIIVTRLLLIVQRKIVVWHPQEITPGTTTTSQPSSSDHPSSSTEFSTSTTPSGGTDYPSGRTQDGTGITHPGVEHPSNGTESSTATSQPRGTDYPSPITGHVTGITQPGGTDHTSTNTVHVTGITQPGGTDHPSSITGHVTGITHPGVTDHPLSSTGHGTGITHPGVTDHPSSSTGHGTGITHPGVTDHPSSSTGHGTGIPHPGVTVSSSSTTGHGTGITHPGVTDHPSSSTGHGTGITHPGGTVSSSSTTEHGTGITHPGVTDHPTSSTGHGTGITHPGVTDHPTSSTGHGTGITHPGVTDHPSSSTGHGTGITHPGGTDHPSSSTGHGTGITHPGVTDHPSSSTGHGTGITHPGVTDHPSSSTGHGTGITHPGVTDHPSSSTGHGTGITHPGVTDHPSSSTGHGTGITHPGGTVSSSSTTGHSTGITHPGVTDHPLSSTGHGTGITHPGVTDHPSSSTGHDTGITHPGVTDHPSSSTGHGTGITHPDVTDHPLSSTGHGTGITHPGVTDHPLSSTGHGTGITHPGVTDHPSSSTGHGTGITHPGGTVSSSSTTGHGTGITHPGVTDHPSSSTGHGTGITHPGVTDHPSSSTGHGTGITQSGGTNQPSITTGSDSTVTQSSHGDHSPAVTLSPTGSSPGKPVQPTVAPIVPQEVPTLPKDVNPTKIIHIEITELGIPIFEFTNINNSKNVVTVPSVTCLQKTPSAGDSKDKCATDTEIYITEHLIQIFGKDYIQVILGENWRERYTTKVSLLLALLEKVQNTTKIQGQQELIAIIKRYKVAIKSVATYVFLPLIVQQQRINTKIVWSTFDYNNPSTSYIESGRPTVISTNMITLPLVNPIYWLMPVDLTNPYKGLFPVLPANNPDAQKLQPLIKIFTIEEVHNWLGVDWNPSVYPNRGALFISALRILLTREEVKTNRELYTLIHNYLTAIELPAVHVHIPTTYIQRTIIRRIGIVIPRLPIAISKIETVIPATVNPKTKIQIVVSELGIPHIESLATYEGELSIQNVLTLPSVVCLQQAPSTGNAQDKCEIDVDVHVRQILIQAFGKNYIQIILGDNAMHIYSTRISLLVALLEKAQKHTNIGQNVEFLKIIRRYEIALKSVASYILLPLIVHYQKITNIVVWLTYDVKKSQTNITITPPFGEDDDIITLPLINPATWVLQVDEMEPFSGLVPSFVDSESPYAVQVEPLIKLIQSGQIYELLGSNWKVSQFPNRGALYISVLHRLLTIEQVRTNTQLYTLLQHYLKAIELSSINVHITYGYLETIINRWKIENDQIIRHEDPLVANSTARDDILVSALIIPNKDLKATVKSSTRIFVQSSRALEQLSPDTLTLPSVNCLQAFPDQDDDEYCEQFPDLPMLPQLMETLGEAGTEEMMNENWDSEYPTMVAFLQNLCLKAVRNEKVAKNKELVAEIEKYRTALEFAAASIFLPLLTNYQEIDVELIWLTYDTTDYRQSHMSLHRTETDDQNVVTLPLVNPKVWLQSVNVEHPFTSFLPILPATDPYAAKIKPLLKLFNSGEVLLILGKNFIPANYPNRGALFLATLRTLLDSPSVVSNKELHTLVERYFTVIQVVSLYVHIPRSWINNGYTKAQYTWNIDVADLYTALPVPQTAEERQYFYLLQSFLRTENLLQMLDIHLPALSVYKAELLIMIVKRTLVSSFRQSLGEQLTAALQYYSAKAELALVARGGVVRWIWVPRVKGIIRSRHMIRLDIGKIFIMTIPLSRLKTKEAKVHYFKLIKFMNDNRKFLNTDDFMYKRYPNHGQFLRAYLNHLVRRPNIDKDAKVYIDTVVEFIRNTGPGAVPINIPKSRRTNSKH